MKVYRVWGTRHETVVFAESEEEARARALESGEVQEWEKELVGELLVEEVPLPEGWELRRSHSAASLLLEGKDIILEIDRLLYRDFPIAPGTLEDVRDAIGKAKDLGLLEEAIEVLLEFIVMQEVDRAIHERRAEMAAQRAMRQGEEPRE